MLSDIYKKQRQLLADNTSSGNIYIISDFQKSTADINNISTDTNTTVYLIPIAEKKHR